MFITSPFKNLWNFNELIDGSTTYNLPYISASNVTQNVTRYIRANYKKNCFKVPKPSCLVEPFLRRGDQVGKGTIDEVHSFMLYTKETKSMIQSPP